MSKLIQQLKVILPALSEEANRCRDREVKERYYLIKAVAQSKKSVVKTCSSQGRSTDYFYLWAKRLVKQKKIKALKSISRRAKYSPIKTKRQIEKKIIQIRKAEPYLGPDRISFDLKRLFKIICAPSTVYAVLKRKGLITIEKMKKLTKRHIKRYRRPLPGFMQMDVKYVTMKIHGKQYYQFNVVDHCTTWRFTRIYPSLQHENVLSFLMALEHACPFPIFEMQTDNGTEFTDKYRGGRLTPSGLHVLDLWCTKLDIRHRLIPVGEKELNGKVENTHKQDDREFYSQINPRSLDHVQRLIISYNERWNSLRYTKALGRKTPDQALEDAYVRALVGLSIMTEKYKTNKNNIINWDEHFNASIPAPTPPLIKTRPTARKGKNSVNRYFQWLDWDEKKSSKSIFFVPMMSPISSRVEPRPRCKRNLVVSMPGCAC